MNVIVTITEIKFASRPQEDKNVGSTFYFGRLTYANPSTTHAHTHTHTKKQTNTIQACAFKAQSTLNSLPFNILHLCSFTHHPYLNASQRLLKNTSKPAFHAAADLSYVNMLIVFLDQVHIYLQVTVVVQCNVCVLVFDSRAGGL